MSSDMRAELRELVRRLCESVAREMELQAQVARLQRELEEVRHAYRRH